MRKRILDFLKLHNGILQIIYLVGHLVLRFIGMFCPIKNKQIIFASYGGKKFDDSPKVIYNAICKDKYFENWELIWAFVNPDDFSLIRGKKVKIDTLTFFIKLLSSKVWISNSGMDRNLGLCKKDTISIETWHGTPIKKIGADQQEGNSVAVRWNYTAYPCIRCAQSQYDLEIFERVMNAKKEEFLLCDLPRNDILANYNQKDIQSICKKLNIPKGKKVLLYMPTYREYLIDKNNACYIAPPITLSKWEEKLSDKYILLFRAHYEVTKIMDLTENEFVKDVSNYPDVNDLYLISDILISDYSSAFFDYSILGRPMLCFAYDLEEYSKKRGLYLNLEKELPCSIDRTEEMLINKIISLNYEKCCKKTKKFHEKYTSHAGNATNTIIERLKVRLE